MPLPAALIAVRLVVQAVALAVIEVASQSEAGVLVAMDSLVGKVWWL